MAGGDVQYEELSAAIDRRLSRFEKTMELDNCTAERYRELFANHQPEDRRSGSRCGGSHVSAAPGIQGMLQAMSGEVSPSRKTEVQRIQGAQWISFIFAEWNDHYRFELAKVWDCSHRDYAFPFFGDLAKIRNDYIHNGGIAKRSTASCPILNWFSEGEQMFLTSAMYNDAIGKWPWDELLRQPRPSTDSRNQFPGRAPLSLIDTVQRAAAADGVKPDQVIEDALQLWLQRDEAGSTSTSESGAGQ